MTLNIDFYREGILSIGSKRFFPYTLIIKSKTYT